MTREAVWLLLAITAVLIVYAPRGDSQTDGARSPVVVELFTSEGCSSCPPADALLTELDRQPIPGAEISPLGIHVDYWNQLGWTDRFSSKEFTGRQNAYARHFRLDSVYTPQMVIDGRYEFTGNDSAQARKIILAEAKASHRAHVDLQQGDDHTLQLRVDDAGSGPAEVLFAITESGLSTAVRAGENSGRELRHAAVVRELTKLGSTKSGHFETKLAAPSNKQWNRASLRAVAFVQAAGTGEILGAAAIPLK